MHAFDRNLRGILLAYTWNKIANILIGGIGLYKTGKHVPLLYELIVTVTDSRT